MKNIFQANIFLLKTISGIQGLYMAWITNVFETSFRTGGAGEISNLHSLQS